MRRFQELLVWRKAHRLVIETYRSTQQLPVEERFGIAQQMRRASVSVAANIAEGHRRRSKLEFLRFLNVAHSSLDELAYYFLLAMDLQYLDRATGTPLMRLADEVGRMLNGLVIHVQQEVRNA